MQMMVAVGKIMKNKNGIRGLDDIKSKERKNTRGHE